VPGTKEDEGTPGVGFTGNLYPLPKNVQACAVGGDGLGRGTTVPLLTGGKPGEKGDISVSSEKPLATDGGERWSWI
jgi:ABC-type uncharacterized transport system ATPase subunit